MIVVLSDTHRREGTGLRGRTRTAVEEADRVLHLGDFTTVAVLEAFQGESPRLDAVRGNRDTPAVGETVPAERIVSIAGLTAGMTHRKDGGETALEMWGRSHDADLVFWGHMHRPSVLDTGDVVLVNPGSHHEPRGGPATHVELRPDDEGVSGAVMTRDGDRLARIAVPSGSEEQERGK